ncbi:MAG: hypothetical protein JWQ76_4853 [Ramlibacter sp.]|nr:hypothetical protein [Ramlibacter sp.]
MNRADIDSSLCSGERPLESLDDGFSPPVPDTPQTDTPAAPGDAELALSTKSPF